MERSVEKIVLFFLLFFYGLVPLSAQSIGGTTSGAATYCSSINSGFISLTGQTGSVVNWESSTDGGTTWSNIGNVTTSQSYFNLSQSTCYRVIVQNGAFPPDTSSISCITIFPPSVGGTISGGGTFCSNSGSGTLTLSGETGNVLNWQSSTDGGSTWSLISDTTTSYNYSGITINTIFSAVVQSGSCPIDTSLFATFTIIPASVGGFVSADDTVCNITNSGILSLSANTGIVLSWISSIDGGSTWAGITATGNSLPYSGLTQTTLFAAIVQSASCLADTSSPALITVLPPFPLSAGNDTSILFGQSLTLQGSGSGIPLWSPSADLDTATIYNPLATPAQSTNYILSVTNTNGCTSSDAVFVTVIFPSFEGIITNLFTPNGDGVNENWHIENIENYPDNEVSVFNIYGQVVYNQKSYKNDWKGTYNGSELPDGTYYYVLKIANEEKPFKGSVDILRNK